MGFRDEKMDDGLPSLRSDWMRIAVMHGSRMESGYAGDQTCVVFSFSYVVWCLNLEMRHLYLEIGQGSPLTQTIHQNGIRIEKYGIISYLYECYIGPT